MIPTFDVFRFEADGRYWVDAAVSVEDSKTRVRELLSLTPGQTMILSQETNVRFMIEDGAAVPLPVSN